MALITIRCLTFLPSLIFNAFATSYRRSMRTVNVQQRQINKMSVFPCQPGKYLFPVSEFTPFPVMVEYGFVSWYLSLKEMTYPQMLPLITGLELVKNSRNDRNQVEFTGESSFCYACGFPQKLGKPTMRGSGFCLQCFVGCRQHLKGSMKADWNAIFDWSS